MGRTQPYWPYSLDADNLELQILQVLAVNIAETPNQPHSDVSIITRGLPEDIVADDEDTEEIWVGSMV
jgi:hypothetical protein